jgi:dihydropteroate synthase
MARELYLRPVGFHPHGLAVAGAASQPGMRLAGGWSNFTALEITRRSDSADARALVPLDSIWDRDWGRQVAQASAGLDGLLAPRPRIAGLALDHPRIMGIVNVTPDSFSDGGRLQSVEAAIAHGLRLVAEGADCLDVGGESTRPGSDAVSLKDELARVLPVIEGLAARTEVPISIDTRKAEVMRRAAQAGASIINDVAALTYDPGAIEAVAETGLPVILMHALGDPKTMQERPVYANALLDVFDFLEARIEACLAAGIPLAKIVADPGIGFGKTAEHNIALMSGLSLFHALGVPILLGASRKRFIGALTGVDVAADRVHGSVGAALAGVAQGVQMVRVHDVAATRAALTVFMASMGCGEAPSSL